MANDYSQNLIAFLASDATVRGYVASRICQNNVPTGPDATKDYLWLRRSGQQYERTLDEAAGTPPRSVLFDVEACSRDLDRACKIADSIRALFPFSGTFGDSSLKGAFVNDQSEDYVPLNENATIGVHVESLQVEICA
jgi:hypothetical protein